MTPLRLRLPRLSLPRLNLPELCLLAALGYGLFQFAAFARQIVAYPYQVDYGEGPLLSQVGRLAQFENIYRSDLSKPPYTVANYPPLYMLLQVPLHGLLGPAFWYGRALSLLGMAAAALFLGLTLHKLTGDRLAALVGGLLLFAIPYVRTWAPLFRIDPLALGLSWAGLYAVVRLAEGDGAAAKRPAAALWPAALLLTAAIYTRQSYGLAAPLAALAFLLSRPPRRRAFQLAAGVGGLSLALFLLLNLLTGGGFYFNIVTANLNKFQLPTLLRYAGLVGADLPLLLAVGGLVLALGWLGDRRHTWPLAGPYLAGAALSALTIGKIGSNVNYLLELAAALGLAAGLALAWLRRERDLAGRGPVKMTWRLACWGLALLLAGQAAWAARSTAGYQSYLLSKAGQRTLNEVLLRLVEQSPGPVLTGEHMGLLALTGRPIYYQPFEMKQLSDGGGWDQTPFLRELESGRYPLILMFRPPFGDVHARRWTPEMLAVIQKHYRAVNNFEHTVVYEWRK